MTGCGARTSRTPLRCVSVLPGVPDDRWRGCLWGDAVDRVAGRSSGRGRVTDDTADVVVDLELLVDGQGRGVAAATADPSRAPCSVQVSNFAPAAVKSLPALPDLH